jgi:hypothetical protein
MNKQRAAMAAALEALEQFSGLTKAKGLADVADAASTALRAALAEPVGEPVGWTPREIELIDGMIEVQLQHAQRCDGIANRTMAEKQKTWDLERVALLQKIKAAAQPPAPGVELTDEEIIGLWYPAASISEPGQRRVAFARAAIAAHEQKQKENK